MSGERAARRRDRARGETARSAYGIDRGRLRNPQIDTEPAQSPLDALAKGLVSIGEKFRSRPRLRVL